MRPTRQDGSYLPYASVRRRPAFSSPRIQRASECSRDPFRAGYSPGRKSRPGHCCWLRPAHSDVSWLLPCVLPSTSLARGRFFCHAINLDQHLLYAPTNFFAFFPQADHFAAQAFHYFFPLLELFTQPLHVPLSNRTRLTGRL